MTKPGRLRIVYDGACPFCANYVDMLRLREAIGPVELVDARSDHSVVKQLKEQGYDLNDGMAVLEGSEVYFSDEAVHRLALMATPSGVFNRLNALVFRHPKLARWLYPPMRSGRSATLRLLGRKPI